MSCSIRTAFTIYLMEPNYLIYAHRAEVQVIEASRALARLLPKMYNAVVAQVQQRKSKKAQGNGGMVR
jgi:hypothetical protein